MADTVNPSCGAWLGGTLTADFFLVEGADTTMQVFKRFIAVTTVFMGLAGGAGVALAASGQPSPWEMGLQGAASPVMESIISFHDFLLYVITAITIFVLALLLYIIVKFNAKANPTPSRTTTWVRYNSSLFCSPISSFSPGPALACARSFAVAITDPSLERLV